MNLRVLGTKINDNYYILRKIYIIVFVILLFIRSIMLDSNMIWARIDLVLFSGLLLSGLLLILWDVFNKKYLFMSKHNIWLCGFIVVFLISIILNSKYGIFSNIRLLGYTCIFFFLMYSMYVKRESKDVNEEIRLISNTCIVLYLFSTLVSLYMFIFQIGYVEYSTKIPLRRGFYENRLFGIFADPNDAAIVSIIVIIFSIFNYKLAKKKYLKIFYICSIILQFIYVVLSGSRTAEVVIFVVCVFLSWIFLVKYLSNKNYNVIIKSVISIFSAIFVGFLLMLSITLTRNAMSYVPSIISQMSVQVSSSEDIKNIKPVILKRNDVENSDDISNLRFSIWKDAIEIFKHKPIFGFSPRNFQKYIKNEFSNGFMARHKYIITHNVFIEVLVCTGILGLIFVIGFFVNILKDLLSYILFKRDDKYYKMAIFTSVIILSVAIESMFFTEIFFMNNIRTLLFWLFLGYTMYFIKQSESKPETMPITYIWCDKIIGKIKKVFSLSK